MKESSIRIVCRKRFKILNTLVFVGFGLMLIFLSVIALLKPDVIGLAIEKTLPGWWFIFIVGLLLYQVSSPDVMISEAGIEVLMLRRTFLVLWDQIVQVKIYKYSAIFEVEKLTPLNRIVGILAARTLKPSFVISWVTHTRYPEAKALLLHRLGSRFVTFVR